MEACNVLHQWPEFRDTTDILGDVVDILRSVRINLGMDMGFISQFVGTDRVFRHIDTDLPDPPFQIDEVAPLVESYCLRVVDGRLPELIPDTGKVPEAQAVAATHDLPIGAHLSVPLRLSDGKLYGTFCCFNRKPIPTLDLRDLRMLRTFADFAVRRIEERLTRARLTTEKLERIEAALHDGAPTIVFQPVFMLDGLRLAGSEALSRFPMEPRRPPNEWFAEAREVGLQADLEMHAIRTALRLYGEVWRSHRIQLGINASPTTILDPRFPSLFNDAPKELLVIEVTEHEMVKDYAPLVAEFACMRAEGMKVAIDDVGSGYASMRHILAIRPNIMKLDMDIVRGIDKEPMKLALATALMGFAADFDCRVVAEGVETEGELETMRRLNVQGVQGYLLARPQPVSALLARLGSAPSSA